MFVSKDIRGHKQVMLTIETQQCPLSLD